MRRAVFQLAWHLHRLAYRLLGRSAAGTTTLELRTIGRRSGQPRMTLLTFVPDGPRRVVVASNAGAAGHPAWWHNLRAQPSTRIVVDGRTERVRAREASGAERDELWARFVAQHPGYAGYARLAGDRQVPVVVLEPASDGAADR